MWDGLFDKDENVIKNPLYYHDASDIDKKNTELKRSLNTMKKFKEDQKTEDLLSKKDFAALEKGVTAYENLLIKRERASRENKDRAAKEERKKLRGAKWIKSNFKKIDVEFMLNVIYADNIKYKFWNYYNDAIEEKFDGVIVRWGGNMETKEDAVTHVEKLYAALGNTSHAQYERHAELVKLALIEYKKEGDR